MVFDIIDMFQQFKFTNLSANQEYLAAHFSFLKVKEVVRSSNCQVHCHLQSDWALEQSWEEFFFFLKKETSRELWGFEMWRAYPHHNTNRGHSDYFSLKLVKKDHVTFWPFKDEIICHRGLFQNGCCRPTVVFCKYCNYSCHVNESNYFFQHLMNFPNQTFWFSFLIMEVNSSNVNCCRIPSHRFPLAGFTLVLVASRPTVMFFLIVPSGSS